MAFEALDGCVLRFMVRNDVKRSLFRQLLLIANSDLEHTSFEVLRRLCFFAISSLISRYYGRRSIC